jgi:hypothetical protein
LAKRSSLDMVEGVINEQMAHVPAFSGQNIMAAL